MTAITIVALQISATNPSVVHSPSTILVKFGSSNHHETMRSLSLKWKSRSPPPTRLIKANGNNPFTFEIGSPFMPSLDRIASRHGYTATNSRVVIWFANQAKSNLDDDEFFDLLRLVVTGITTSRRRRPPGARSR
jgi:hypothetical protein